MRTIVCLLLLGCWCSTCQAQDITGVDPADTVNWLPVTIAPPSEFGAITSVRVRSNDASVSGDFIVPTAPYPFWIKRNVDPHPGHSTWWVSLGIFLNGSPIGGGQNIVTLVRDEALASSVVLRPKPEFYPPLTPPNDRVVWSRFWTVDDGTPRDALTPTDFRPVPEPSCAAMALMAVTAGSLWRRRRTR
jgi:hypothetical protein